jgi:hypothetical protein
MRPVVVVVVVVVGVVALNGITLPGDPSSKPRIDASGSKTPPKSLGGLRVRPSPISVTSENSSPSFIDEPEENAC